MCRPAVTETLWQVINLHSAMRSLILEF